MKSKSLRILGGIVGFFVVLVLVSGCTPKPEKELKKMMAEMSETSSVETQIKFGLTGMFPEISSLNESETDLKSGSVVLNIEGALDYNESLVADLKADADYNIGESKLNASADLIVKDNILYLKLDKTPKIAMINLEQLKGNWYKFDLNDYKKSNPESENSIDESKNKKLRKLLRQTDFFEVFQDFGTEDLNGVQTKHYKISLDHEELKEFIVKSSQIIDNIKMDEGDQKKLSEDLKKVSDLEADIWFGADDYLIYKLNIDSKLEIDGQNTLYNLTAEFDNYNKQLDIKVPENVRDFNMAEAFLPPELSSESLPSQGVSENMPVDIEQKLKEIEGMDPVEFKKQMDELQRQVEGMKE